MKDSTPEIEFRPGVYPQLKILLMPAIQERVPVFEETFQIRQDARGNAAFSFSAALPPGASCPPRLPSNGAFMFCRPT